MISKSVKGRVLSMGRGITEAGDKFMSTSFASQFLYPIEAKLSGIKTDITVGCDETLSKARRWANPDVQKELSKDEAEFVKSTSDIFTKNDFKAMNEIMQSEEKLASFKMFSSCYPNYYSDLASFKGLVSRTTANHINEKLEDMISKDPVQIERIVWFIVAKHESFDFQLLNDAANISGILKDKINEVCRKNSITELFAVAKVDSSSAAKFVVNPSKTEMDNIVPIRFTTTDNVTENKVAKEEKTAREANVYIESIKQDMNNILPNMHKVYVLNSNGSLSVHLYDVGEDKTKTTYKATFELDPNVKCGNGHYIGGLGTNQENSICWIPVPFKEKELVTKVLTQPGYILNKAETKLIEDKYLLDEQWLYNYVDLSNNSLEKISLEDYKALGATLSKVIKAVNSTVRYRLTNYSSPTKFELVSDDKVIMAFETCVKNISGEVLTVDGNSVICTNAFRQIPPTSILLS